jgi:hypothetical protein
MNQELKARYLGVAAFLVATQSILLVEQSAAGGLGRHGWTVSASTSDPYVQDVKFTKGPQEFAIWLVCTDDDPEAGLSFANLTFQMSGGPNTITAFTPAEGWQGTFIDDPYYPRIELTPSNGCVNGESLAGTVTVEVSNPGRLCLFGEDIRCDSYQTFIEWLGLDFGGGVCGSACRVCAYDTGLCWANEICHIGYIYCDAKGHCVSTSDYCDCRANNGYCGDCKDCPPSSIEANTWGRVKASYR